MQLAADVCRCWDDGCGEHERCLRWLDRRAGTNHCKSLFPYDIPLGDPCPLRIAPQETKNPRGRKGEKRRAGRA